ncbi:MAG: hypothetical protein QOG49_9 [Frankiaceae bacterium]|nr:hypothetical protein [Frankiaceae bacterium]
MTEGAGPGWYPDPRGGDDLRYWTGDSWAADVAPPPQSVWQRPDPAAPGAVWPAAAEDDVPAYPQPAPAAPTWRSAATWLALAAGLLAGFGGGYAVARARPGGSAAKARVSTPSTAASPAPSGQPAPGPTPEPTPSSPGGSFDSEASPPGAASPRVEPTDPDAALLDRLGLRVTDVDPPAEVGLIPGGDQVAGETTLDLCDGTFPSEARRTARRQLAAVVPGGDGVVLSTEAVLYDAPIATASAFAELKGNAASCNATTGVDKAWPQVAGVERLAFQTVTPAPGSSSPAAPIRTTAVYMRSGRTLLALYFGSASLAQTPVGGQQTEAAVTAVFAKRLAAMPSSATVT